MSTIKFASSPQTSLSLRKEVFYYLCTLELSFFLPLSNNKLFKPTWDSSGYLPSSVPVTAGF